MAYTQPVTRRVVEPDRLTRKVLFALEVLDPVTRERVSRGLIVAAKGLTGEPLLSWSGRFVWLLEGEEWPEEVSVVPVRLPYLAARVRPAKPPNWPEARAEERLVRVTLRPTPAYEFSGVTAIRGELRESLNEDAARVSGAGVQLLWFDKDAGVWVPAASPDGGTPATDANGEFAVFLRLMPALQQDPDIQEGMLRVRLQFTRSGIRRATPDDFAFVADPKHKGRVPEGQLSPRDLKLGWSDLQTM